MREATAEVEPTTGHCGQGIHDRHGGAGVPARRQRADGRMERGWIRTINYERGLVDGQKNLGWIENDGRPRSQ